MIAGIRYKLQGSFLVDKDMAQGEGRDHQNTAFEQNV